MKVLMKSRVPNSLTILLCEQEKDDVPTETIRMKDLDFHIDNIDYPMRRKTPCFSYGDIRRVHRIYASN